MSAYGKNVLRTIMGNKRRSIMLALITALGAAFFVGLRSTSPDMNITLDRYFDDRLMYDIQVIGSLGLTGGDIAELRDVRGVERVEPGYSADLFAKVGDASYLTRFHSCPESGGGPTPAEPMVLQGRLPEASGECAVSFRFAQMADCSPGDVLTLSTGDDSDLGDYVSRESYVITGLVESPLYIRMDLGSSNKGSGTLQAYAYIPFDDFAFDAYTEAQVFISNPGGYSRFDDRYKTLSADAEDELQRVGDRLAADRRKVLMARASKEISGGTAAVAAARAGLAEGETELEQAELALSANEAELARQRAELERSVAEAGLLLESGGGELERAREELERGRRELAQFSSVLPEAEYAKRLEQLVRSEAELVEREDTLRRESASLDKTYYDSLARLSVAESALAQAKNALTGSRLSFEAQKASAEAELMESEMALDAARRTLENIPEDKCYVLGFDQSMGFASFEQDSQRIDSISRVFPLIFFLVAALVAFTSMVRIIEDDRPSVAAMRSLGYGPAAVAGKYLTYAFCVGVPGTALGIAVGYRLFPASIFNFGYKIMYLIPEIETPLHPGLCAGAFAISLVSVAIPTVLVSTQDILQSPAALMRPKAPRPGKRILLERIPPLWSRMSFSAKVTARNILRYKKRFLMTVTGIVGCTAIMLTGFGLRDSIKSIAANQFDRIYRYNFQITTADTIGRSDLLALERFLAQQDDVSGMQRQYRKNYDATSQPGAEEYEVTLTVPEDAAALDGVIRLADYRTGERLIPSESGVIITQKLASLLDLGAGDELTITDDDEYSFSFKIAGVAENYVNHYVYMTAEHYASVWGSAPEYNTLLCSAQNIGEERRDLLSEDILELEGVSALSFIEKVRDFYADTIDSLNVVVLILIISGALLAFVVLFSLTGINIDERKRELATLKVLGFYDGETSSYIFRENIINTVVGTALGLAAGVGLHRYVIYTSEIDMVMFGRQIEPLSYLAAAALTFLFMSVVNAAMNGSIRNIDMIESLKSVE